MDEEIVFDNDVLISLVEARPVLWDKTLDTFKDRNATKEAWRQVCCTLKEDFEETEIKEKNAFGKAVTRRWGNLCDAFSKSKRKLKESKRSGAGATKIKKYIYTEQMQFLNKLYQSRGIVDSLEDVVVGDGDADDEEVEEIEGQVHRRESKDNITNPRKRRRPDEIELKMLKALEEPTPSPHMSFFQGLLPHLNKFDDGEVLEFQMDVLRTIAKINSKRKISQPLPLQVTPYNFHNYPLPQPQPFPHPQPSCSNRFPSDNNYQASFSHTYQFRDPKNSNYSNINIQQPCSSQKQSPVTHQEQTTSEFYQQFGHSSTTTPDNDLSASTSPSTSVCTDTFDFS